MKGQKGLAPGQNAMICKVSRDHAMQCKISDRAASALHLSWSAPRAYSRFTSSSQAPLARS